MNAKTPNRKSKTAPTRAAGKNVSSAASNRRQPSTAPVSLVARKSTVTKRAKATAVTTTTIASPIAAGHDSKQARLISMLRTKPGTTIDQMMSLTGWQAHTIRGTISGVLRKKLGLNVTCQSSKGTKTRRYRIVGVAA